MEFSDILALEKELSKILRPTPLIKSYITDSCQLYLKPENLQFTGSFKVRGAYNKITHLTEEEKSHGVIACSAGNHAQGVALAASDMGIRSIICMPKSAPKVKIEATKKLGGEVILVDGAYDDAYEKALELQEQYGYTFVHPFNDEEVIAGQATIGFEIMKELNDADAVLCAVGGGGLISGVSYVVKHLNPNCKVYGVQSSGAPSMYASVANGYITKLHKVKTFADGIAVKEVGNITFDYVNKYVDDILTVTDAQILDAIKILMNREKLVSEGAGAAPVAAVLNGLVPGINKDSKVVCVVSGGNIDIDMLAKIVTEGL